LFEEKMFKHTRSDGQVMDKRLSPRGANVNLALVLTLNQKAEVLWLIKRNLLGRDKWSVHEFSVLFLPH
jgi:hypothetical protein